MIAGLCESPLTFQAVIIWRDELNGGKVFLRDIIDLEATYAGPDAKNSMAARARRRGRHGANGGQPRAPPRRRSRRPRRLRPRVQARGRARPTARRVRAARRRRARRLRRRRHGEFAVARRDRGRAQAQGGRDASTRSPTTFKRLRRLQDQDIQLQLKSDALSPAQERKYKKLKEEIIAEVKSLRLNQGRIDALVEQLYDINKRLVGYEGRLMRLSESYGVVREDFLKNYQGSELDPRWLNRVSKLSAKGWKNLVAKGQGQGQGDPRPDPSARRRDRPRDRRVPQDRADGAEGRARGAPGEEGNGGGEPAPRHLHRQEVHQPRPAVPRPDPGRQHRPDEGGRQVRVPPRLQVLDLCHLVDPAGDHPLDRRSGAHHPHPGAHDRDDQQDRPHLAPDAQRDRPRADPRGARREARHAAREGAQGP